MTLKQLLTVLASTRRSKLAIKAWSSDTHVHCLKGNFRVVTAPKSWFTVAGDGVEPDFADVEAVDYGQTIRLGDYEADFDFLRETFDPKYVPSFHRQR